MSDQVLEQVKQFPATCGIYMMKDRRGRILYVGKAANLRKRVRSYFRSHPDSKVGALMQRTARIDYTITNSVYEALLLECNLIKQWRPKYNIDLKDGKSYPLIRITNERYPRVFRTRTMVQDGSRYFGPYIHSSNLYKLLDELLRLYPLRKCHGPVKTRPHPCLHYHIGRCAAACAGKISHADYLARIEQIARILDGDTAEVSQHIHLKIVEAIAKQQFERAGLLRDALMAIKIIEEGQHIIDFQQQSTDYFGYAVYNDNAIVSIFKTRAGKLIATENYRLDHVFDIDEQAAQMIIQYYAQTHHIPDELVVSSGSMSAELSRYFVQERAYRIRVHSAENEKEQALLRLALKNAHAALLSAPGVAPSAGAVGATEPSDRPFFHALEELRAVLQLPRAPTYIEGFDIAHIGGRHTVAALTVFRDGALRPAEYRRYRIASLAAGKIDDFAAMREVVARRYMRLLNEDRALPDLILIDGGIGQVHAAQEILDTLSIGHLPVVGIAKRNEELYVSPPRAIAALGTAAAPTSPETMPPAAPPDRAAPPLILPRRSPALILLQAVRDEAHRFATAYRASQQQRQLRDSALQSINGIGKKRAALLYRRYSSIADMAAAPAAELATLLTMGSDRVRAVQQALRTLAESSA